MRNLKCIFLFVSVLSFAQLFTPWPGRLAWSYQSDSGRDARATNKGTPWEELPVLPDPHGFAGAFAGVVGSRLVVIGGANFPDAPPWMGGTKTWYPRVHALVERSGNWERLEDLPREIGYGVSVTTAEGLVCIGGSDAKKHYRDVFLVRRKEGAKETFQTEIVQLPPLPVEVANMCGARVGDDIYVAGGISNPNATEAFSKIWVLPWRPAAVPKTPEESLPTDWKWTEVPTWPGEPRMLAAAAGDSSSFYLLGGVSLSPDEEGKPRRKYLRDGYSYSKETGWVRIADLPAPSAASPSPGFLHEGKIMILGGDSGGYASSLPMQEHPGFSHRMWEYDLEKKQWEIGEEGPVGAVTTNATIWKGGYVVPTGEIRPGVRSPRNWYRMQN